MAIKPATKKPTTKLRILAALCKKMNKTHFLNIDLDLESEQEISRLVEELSLNLTQMTYHKCEDMYRASFESSESGIEDIIEKYISTIHALTSVASEQWKNCKKREFNVGFQAENTPRGYVQSISSESLSEISSVSGQIGITIYAPESNFT